MNEMQWALLIIGVVVVVGVYFHARRQAAKQAVWNKRKNREGQEEDQLDFFDDASGGFDEFGVGKARSRQEPRLDGGSSNNASEVSQDDDFGGLFVVSIHRSDLGYVPGEQLHQALEECGLQFGAHDVYHRYSAQGDRVFSVTSMVKPGFLIPEEKDQLRTPGVSLYLQLPGCMGGEAAFDDLITTAQTLADRLDATMLDRNRQPLAADLVERMRKAAANFE